MTAPPVIGTTAAAWQAKLGELGAVVDALPELLQAVRIILTTPIGSVPHRPDFGCDLWRWIDRPLDIARPNIVSAIVAAITQWEPRAVVKEATVTPQPSGESGFILSLELQPIGDANTLSLLMGFPSGEVLE